MKLPRGIGGEKLARALGRMGYGVTRQTGSHMRLTTAQGGTHHVTVPRHRSLKVGTLSELLKDVAAHANLTREDLAQKLFG